MRYNPGMALVETLRRTITTHNLFSHDELIMVAISGGPDSTSLLHALHGLGYKLHAAHLNHGFRGEEAEGDTQYVRDLCVKLGVPLEIVYKDVPEYKRSEKLSAQVAARRVRYAFLEEAAQMIGASLIATAHNQDDRIETLLLNLVRGTGTDGLRGVPYRRLPYVRPLLDVPRSEIEYYCEEFNLLPRRDSSNYSSAYSRNNIRKELIPYLERRYNESIRLSLLRLSDIAAAESDYLQDVAKRWMTDHSFIPVAPLVAEPVALQRRIIREYIRSLRRTHQLTDISHEMVERIRSRAGHDFALMLPGADWIVYGTASSISMRQLAKPDEISEIDIPITVAEPVAFLAWDVTVTALPDCIDTNQLRLRTWRNGDRITTRGGTRKLQDVFTDAKIPREERRQWPILIDSEGILAVPTLAYSTRAPGLEVVIERQASLVEGV